jgi:hypothetical protein
VNLGPSCSFKERAPDMKLTWSTIHPWCCIVLLRSLRRDSYWFSVLSRSLRRYESTLMSWWCVFPPWSWSGELRPLVDCLVSRFDPDLIRWFSSFSLPISVGRLELNPSSSRRPTLSDCSSHYSLRGRRASGERVYHPRERRLKKPTDIECETGHMIHRQLCRTRQSGSLLRSRIPFPTNTSSQSHIGRWYSYLCHSSVVVPLRQTCQRQ